MQTQDAPAEIIFKLWPWLEANKNRLIGAAGGDPRHGWGICYFISSQQEQKEMDAGQALTLLLVSPNADAEPVAVPFEQFADEIFRHGRRPARPVAGGGGRC